MMQSKFLVPVILAMIAIISIAQAHNSQGDITTVSAKASQAISNTGSSGDAKNMATGDKSDATPSWWQMEAEGPHMI
jgi:hypothetical protein